MVRLKDIRLSDLGQIQINRRLYIWSFLVFVGIGLVLFVPDMIYIKSNQIDYPIYKGLLSNILKFSAIALFIPLLFKGLNRLNKMNLWLRLTGAVLLFSLFIMGHLVFNEMLQQWAGFRPTNKTLLALVEYAAIRGLEVQILSFSLPVIAWYLLLRIKVDNGQNQQKELQAKKQILVKTNGKVRWVPVDQLVHLESNDYYINLFQVDDRVDLIRESMDRIEAQLPASFLRVHRSHIVNLDAVTEVDKSKSGSHFLILRGGKNVPISRSRYQVLKERFLNQTD